MKQKLYPFSARKHAHDVEFLMNTIKNEMLDFDMGDAEYGSLYDRLEELRQVNAYIMNADASGVCFLTGKQIGLAKEVVAWAAVERDRRARK